MKNENTPSDDWAQKHAEYKNTTWINKPSIFAQTALQFFPPSGRLLDLGAGQGQDSRFFAENGYDVCSTDQSADAIATNKAKLPSTLSEMVTIEKVDISQELPYSDSYFDIVYAHLSLHYFDKSSTQKIFSEIHRVLKKGGVLAFLVNSTEDSEYGTGIKIENDYFKIDEKNKRFLSVDSTKGFTKDFTPKLIDNHGETYKDQEKGVHNLIRYIGIK